jgi:hypothetical protein
MTIVAELDVMLKGADLVADTAFLTLRGKMGYEDRLLGVIRLNRYEFRIEGGEPSLTTSALKRFLNTQTLFYNRNKHHFSLRCRWEGGRLDDGVPADRAERSLAAQVRATLEGGVVKDFNGGPGASRGILTSNPVFRTEVLVEDLDAAVKTNMARKLEAEFSTTLVEVSTLGVCWHLALRAQGPEDARTITEEIVVARRRDRGLLSNPNYQGYRVLGVERIEPGG